MNKITICNAFSINMLTSDFNLITFKKVSLNEARDILSHYFHVVSAVGHTDTAAVFSDQLKMDIPVNRHNVVFDDNDVLLIGQLKGGRLPEGTTTLPDNATIEWWLVN